VSRIPDASIVWVKVGGHLHAVAAQLRRYALDRRLSGPQFGLDVAAEQRIERLPCSP
jgi:hypothetical protein